MANFWSIQFVVNLAIFAHIFLQALNLKVLAFTGDVAKKPCFGKHIMGIDRVKTVRGSHMPIKFNNMDELATESTIENNGRILKIESKYNTVPTIKVTMEDLEVVGTFRLKFSYFQWLKKAPEVFHYKNISIPAQFHVVFFNVNSKSYEQAIALNTTVIGLTFPLKVTDMESGFIQALKNNLKYVQQPNTKTVIKNVDINDWLQYFGRHYAVYEGSFPEFSCQERVLWVDSPYGLAITPETVQEFQKLKANEMDPLIKQVSEFFQPRGIVYINENGQMNGAKQNTPAMPGLVIGVLFLIFYSY